MKNNRGFTLLELMIVVSIIGILAAIAFPSYQNSLIKGTRANAKAMLLDVAQREQAYLLDNRSYVAAGTCAAITSALNLTSDAMNEVVKYYTCAITIGSAPPSFQATITPIAGKRMKNDGWLRIDNTGKKDAQVTGNF